MKKLFLFVITLFVFSCSPEDESYVRRDSINQFIWEGLNDYYYWQEESTNLSDNKQSNYVNFTNFLNSYNSPVDFFNACRISSSIDKFSVIYSDYNVLEQVLTGTTGTDGVEYGLVRIANSSQIFGYVRFILPNTDASTKPIQRGDIIWGVNGQMLTLDNYRTLLGATNVTYNLGNYSNTGGNVTVTNNSQSVSTTKSNYSENPVYYTNVYTRGTKKIGYLVYNGFYSNWETQLNTAIAQFKSQNITHLVLDLRYNPGGSVDTANRLASMITGQFTGQIFAKQQWNKKILNANGGADNEEFLNRFTDKLSNGATISSLNLNKLVVLTTSSSASASELLINGLKPYINVTQIGDKTIGKNVGSITIYDSQNYRKQNVNPAHRYAMQPIVLKIANKNNFADYSDGLPPDTLLKESFSNLGQIGSETEPLLQAALNFVETSSRLSIQNQNEFRNLKFESDSKLLIQNNNPTLVVETPEFITRKK